MPRLYGKSISEAEYAELLRRLRGRGTRTADLAADTFSESSAIRHATPESADEVRDAVRLELREWNTLDSDAPGLTAVRDVLGVPPTGGIGVRGQQTTTSEKRADERPNEMGADELETRRQSELAGQERAIEEARRQAAPNASQTASHDVGESAAGQAKENERQAEEDGRELPG